MKGVALDAVEWMACMDIPEPPDPLVTGEHLDAQDQWEREVCQEETDPTVSKDHREGKVLSGILDKRVLSVTPVLLASMGQRATQVGEALKEIRALAVKLVMTEYKASKARWERMEIRVHQGLRAHLAERVLQANQEPLGPQDQEETPAPRAHPAQPAHPALLDYRDRKEHRVTPGPLETVGTRENLGT